MTRMKNIAGHPQASQICADELQEVGIKIQVLAEPHGEPRSIIGGYLNGFTFRRAWVYWCVEGKMSHDKANELNMSPRPVTTTDTKYSGAARTWGDVIRVEGFAGGTAVRADGCDSWHIDTMDGLQKFADHVRKL